MKNMIQPGEVLELTAPYDRLSGQGALIGKIFGVATVDVTNGNKANFAVEGVMDIAKDTSTFSEADPVFWDDSAKKCTSTAAGNTLIGAATQSQLTGDATVRVRLNESAIRQAANEPAVSTANATDLATSEALANQLKTSFNSLLTKLQNAGIMK